MLDWIHLFEQSGFCSINHVATAVSADRLYPPTETILQSLPSEPVQQILEQTYVPKPSEANLRPSRKLAFLPDPEKKVQLNIRMTVKDKKNFVRFCRKHRLKSREALGLMLDQVTEEDTHLQRLLSTRNTLREENIKLKEQLAVAQEKNRRFRKNGPKHICVFCSRDWMYIFSTFSRRRKKRCFQQFLINIFESKPTSVTNIHRRKASFC